MKLPFCFLPVLFAIFLQNCHALLKWPGIPGVANCCVEFGGPGCVCMPKVKLPSCNLLAWNLLKALDLSDLPPTCPSEVTTTTTSTTTTTTPAPGTHKFCEFGWASPDQGENCYKIVPPGPNGLTQAEAEQACVAQGAHLASFRDQISELFATGLCNEANPAAGVSTICWTGAIRITNKQVSQWTDGSATGDYSNWNSGEPAGDGQCVAIYCTAKQTNIMLWNGKWNDLNCASRRDVGLAGGVCKKPGTE